MSRAPLRPLTAAILLLLACAVLYAQPQILPTVEISSADSVRAPLYRKELTFPSEVPADSLLNYVPSGTPVAYVQPQLSKDYHRVARFCLDLDSSLAGALSGTFYLDRKILPLLAFDARASYPEGDSYTQSFGLYAQTRLGKHWLLSHRLDWLDSEHDGFSSSGLGYSLDHRADSLRAFKLSLNQVVSRFSLGQLTQRLGAWDSDEFGFLLKHSHELSFPSLSLKNALLLQDGTFGLASLYQDAQWPGTATDLRLGLMTDFTHLLPAVELFHRFTLAPDRYLELANRPSLDGTQFNALALTHPFSQVPEDAEIAMTPLNFSLQAWQGFGKVGPLQLLGFSHTARYTYNEPQIFSLPGSQTAQAYADILNNVTRLELRLSLGEIKLEQCLELNLEHLPAANWRRKSHSPLLRAATEAWLDLRKLRFALTLEQRYWQTDELGDALPAYANLGLSVSHQLQRGINLKLGLDNLLNTPEYFPGNLPSRGRNAFLALELALDR